MTHTLAIQAFLKPSSPSVARSLTADNRPEAVPSGDRSSTDQDSFDDVVGRTQSETSNATETSPERQQSDPADQQPDQTTKEEAPAEDRVGNDPVNEIGVVAVPDEAVKKTKTGVPQDPIIQRPARFIPPLQGSAGSPAQQDSAVLGLSVTPQEGDNSAGLTVAKQTVPATSLVPPPGEVSDDSIRSGSSVPGTNDPSADEAELRLARATTAASVPDGESPKTVLNGEAPKTVIDDKVVLRDQSVIPKQGAKDLPVETLTSRSIETPKPSPAEKPDALLAQLSAATRNLQTVETKSGKEIPSSHLLRPDTAPVTPTLVQTQTQAVATNVTQMIKPLQILARSEDGDSKVAPLFEGDAMTGEMRNGNQPTSTQSITTTTPLARAELPRHIAMQIHDIARALVDGPVDVSLSPAELGKVRLSISASEGGVVLQVLAERPETLDLMRRNADILARELSDLGFTSIDLAFDQGGQAPSDEQSSDQSQGQSMGREDDAEPNAVNGATSHSINLTPSPEDGLDIRI